MQPSGQDDVVGVIRVVQHELAQRSELGLDRVRPGAVGRCEAQLDPSGGGPGPDLGALVSGEVVEDHVDCRRP